MYQTVEPLNNDSLLWRLDAAGSLSTSKGGRISINFAFSELKSLDQKSSSNSNLTGKTKLVKMHSKWIPLLNLGSVWRNGRHIADTNSIETFKVDTSKTFHLKLEDQLKLENKNLIKRFIPMSYYNFGKNWYNLRNSTNYTIVKALNTDDDFYLIIPDYAIYQRYFSPSDKIASSILSGELDKWIDLDKSIFNKYSPIIIEKKQLTHQERIPILRALTDPIAREALHHPRKKIVTSIGAPSLSALFPFHDTNFLTVSGKRIQLKSITGEPVWGFLVMKIQQCHRELTLINPQIRPQYELTSHGNIIGVNENSTSNNSPIDEFSPPEIIDDSYNPNHKPASISKINNPFPNIDHINFNIVKEYNLDGKNHLLAGDNHDSENSLVIGDPSYESEYKDNQSIQTTESNNQNEVSRDIEDFLDMTDALEVLLSRKKISLAYRILDDNYTYHQNHPNKPVTFFPELKNKRMTWYKIQRDNAFSRCRQIAWLEIILPNNQFIYLLEMELRADEKARSTLIMYNGESFSRITDDIFRKFLTLTARQNTWATPTKKWNTISGFQLSQDVFSIIETLRLNHPSFENKKTQSTEWSKKINTWIEDRVTHIN